MVVGEFIRADLHPIGKHVDGGEPLVPRDTLSLVEQGAAVRGRVAKSDLTAPFRLDAVRADVPRVRDPVGYLLARGAAPGVRVRRVMIPDRIAEPIQLPLDAPGARDAMPPHDARLLAFSVFDHPTIPPERDEVDRIESVLRGRAIPVHLRLRIGERAVLGEGADRVLALAHLDEAQSIEANVIRAVEPHAADHAVLREVRAAAVDGRKPLQGKPLAKEADVGAAIVRYRERGLDPPGRYDEWKGMGRRTHGRHDERSVDRQSALRGRLVERGHRWKRVMPGVGRAGKRRIGELRRRGLEWHGLVAPARERKEDEQPGKEQDGPAHDDHLHARSPRAS